MYAALLVEAIKEIELENCATRAEASASSDSQDMWNDDDRAEYMGWIIDDFPGSAEQVGFPHNQRLLFDKRNVMVHDVHTIHRLYS